MKNSGIPIKSILLFSMLGLLLLAGCTPSLPQNEIPPVSTLTPAQLRDLQRIFTPTPNPNIVIQNAPACEALQCNNPILVFNFDRPATESYAVELIDQDQNKVVLHCFLEMETERSNLLSSVEEGRFFSLDDRFLMNLDFLPPVIEQCDQPDTAEVGFQVNRIPEKRLEFGQVHLSCPQSAARSTNRPRYLVSGSCTDRGFILELGDPDDFPDEITVEVSTDSSTTTVTTPSKPLPSYPNGPLCGVCNTDNYLVLEFPADPAAE